MLNTLKIIWKYYYYYIFCQQLLLLYYLFSYRQKQISHNLAIVKYYSGLKFSVKW